MFLKFDQTDSSYADGTFFISGAEELPVTFYWADESGPLSDYTPIAEILPDRNGCGTFIYTGHRGIPLEARFLMAVNEKESVAVPVAPQPPLPAEEPLRVSVMSDLHLTRKPWRLEKAFDMSKDASLILMQGDLTNDGLPHQFAQLTEIISQRLSDKTVLGVTGNHDYPRFPLPLVYEDICTYPGFQDWLLNRQNFPFEEDKSGAYAVTLGEVEVIGLNAVTHYRKFTFPEQAQIKWLEAHLENSPAKLHMILSHAPLREHNPHGLITYLNKNKDIQRICNAHENILFLSGHTHISMNSPCNPADFDGKNLYINEGSLCTTELLTEETRVPACFTDGNILKLQIWPSQILVTAVSLISGKKIARGYYRFDFPRQ